jgi:hypothetical protein
MLSITSSEDLLPELTLLLHTGKSTLDGLSTRRQRNSPGISHLKLGTNNCCAFFLPIFEKYYRTADKVHETLQDFLTDATALLDNNNNEEEEGEKEEGKVSYNEVADLMQAAKETLPLNNPLPEMNRLEELLNLSIRMDGEITDLSSLNIGDLPDLLQLLGSVEQLPVLVTHTSTLQKLVTFLEAYNKDQRVSLESCVALGFAFTPLTYATTVQAASLTLEKTLLDRSVKLALTESVEKTKSSPEILELKRCLFPGHLHTASLLSADTQDNVVKLEPSSPISSSTAASTSISTSSVTAAAAASHRIDFDTVQRMLDFLQNSIVVFPEEDALRYLVNLPEYVIATHDQDSPSEQIPSISLEEIRERVNWVGGHLLQPDPGLSRFPIISFVKDHYIKPFVERMERWEHVIAQSWMPVKRLLSRCQRGCVLQEEGITTDVSPQESAREGSCEGIPGDSRVSLELLRGEVAKAIRVSRVSVDVHPGEDLDLLPAFVSAEVSAGRDACGLSVADCKEYLLLEEKVAGLLQSVVGDCHFLDTIMTNVCKFSLTTQEEGSVGANSSSENENENDANDLSELKLMLERWNREDHFCYVPLKKVLQEQVYQRHEMVQLLLQLVRQFPVKLQTFLVDCESAVGKAYLQTVLESFLQRASSLRQLHARGLACLHHQSQSEYRSSEGMDENEGIVLSQLNFPQHVEDGINRYLSWVQFEAWCLEALHALWSGAALSTAEELLGVLEGQWEQWQPFISEGDENVLGALWIVNILKNSVVSTQQKQEAVREIRQTYLADASTLNQAYEMDMRPHTTSSHVANAQELLAILVRYMKSLNSIFSSVEEDLQKYPTSDQGLGCVGSADEVLQSIQARASYEFNLSHEKQFLNDIHRMCTIFQNSESLFEFLDIAVSVEEQFLSKLPLYTASLKSGPGRNKERPPTPQRKSFTDVAKCFNIWCTKDPLLVKYLSQPILRLVIFWVYPY